MIRFRRSVSVSAGFAAVFMALFMALAVVLASSPVDARPGGGGSFGSRGSRTFSAPPVTRTAPNAAQPMQRSVTQPSRPSQATPGTAPTGGFFGRPGLMGGLFAGFLGAGLFGMLFGHGLFGGLGGIGSIFGLLLQIGLIVIVGRLIWNWWQRRQGLAYAGGPAYRDVNGGAPSGAPQQPAFGGGASGAPISIEKSDYDTFERLLTDVTLAYGAKDMTRLRSMVTPEMLSDFSADLSEQQSRGLENETRDIKLLQGDLAEAWREGDTDYASVAMRYSLVDAWVDSSGHVAEGSRDPQEVTEIWTFLRSHGGAWILSAIQQS